MKQVSEDLADAIRAYWKEEEAVWESQVEGNSPSPEGSEGIWDSMPAVDSKAVARMSRIFEEHLKIPLDVNLIKSGGYESIDEVIENLVEIMVQKAAEKSLISA
ncbi:MAG: hypothetical protein ACOY5B_08415 [Spirochaetota bacterium]